MRRGIERDALARGWQQRTLAWGRTWGWRTLAIASAVGLVPLLACAQGDSSDSAEVAHDTTHTQPISSEDAQAQELRLAALDALRDGELDRSRQLIDQAANANDDAHLRQMAAWIGDFQAQRDTFEAERHDEYEKQVENVKKLDEAGYLDYAIAWAGRASELAEDKDAFADEPWVRALIGRAAALAEEYEASQDWLKATAIYLELSGIEPYNTLWKGKRDKAARHRRLLAMYTPKVLEDEIDAEGERRDEVDKLLNPTTRPADEVAEGDDAADEDAVATGDAEDDPFRIDWHEMLDGVDRSMLEDALEHVHGRYRKRVDYRELVLGGLDALTVVAETRGLDGAFPHLANEKDRDDFVDALDQMRTATREASVTGGFVKRLLSMLEDVNERTVQLPEEVLIAEFADGALSGLDPFSNMIWPSDLAEFNKSTQGNFSGVGISIRNEPDGDLLVVSPLEDSPAYEAGILAGDIITKIDGKNARNITTNKAVKTITGAAGTPVTLTVRRKMPEGPKELDFKLIRSRITVKSVKGWRHLPGGGWEYLIDPEEKIAYLRITSFTGGTTGELRQAMRQLKAEGARGVILDLRSNPGGLLTSAAEVSDMFLSQGTIVSTRNEREDRNQAVLDARRQASDITDLPLAVLVNEQSASASEIVSGALRDQNRAIIVGQRTFGKGSVQVLFPVGGGRAKLKVTTYHYYLPSGTSIHRDETDREWGVEPDIDIALTPDQMRKAIEARQRLEVLQKADAGGALADDEIVTLQEELLESDPQLAAALLVLRLELATPTLDAHGVAAR